MQYVLPVIFIAVFLYGSLKKVNVYDAFIGGAKSAFDMSLSVFPYLAAMYIMMNLLRESGVDAWLVKILAPPFSWVGIPAELVELVLIRPFSGSGSLALLTEIYTLYGTDSYVARCASVMMGSTETVFYVSAVYFAGTKIKKTGAAIPIALGCTFVGCIVTCLLCRVI